MLHAMVSCICNKPSYGRPLASTSHWTPAEGFINQVFKLFKGSPGLSFMDSKVGCTGNDHQRQCHIRVFCYSLGLRALLKGVEICVCPFSGVFVSRCRVLVPTFFLLAVGGCRTGVRFA